MNNDKFQSFRPQQGLTIMNIIRVGYGHFHLDEISVPQQGLTIMNKKEMILR